MTVHALLVGIDSYATKPLRGAVNDIVAAETFLRARIEEPKVRLLVNGNATRDAVIDGFRTHLANAGKGDVALFWFAGHGSWMQVPAVFDRLEPTGQMQTFVCADSRRPRPDGSVVPDLLDKEVSALLDEVARTGAHVVAVLDSCHSGGATRGLPGSDLTVRSMEPAAEATDPERYLRLIDAHLPDRPAEHVLLAACGPTEKAAESAIGGQVRGVFTHSLLLALQSLEPSATYRELLALAASRVQERTAAQSPLLSPAGYGRADQPFLGGAVRRPTEFHLRWAGARWLVDAGHCHGLPAPGPDGAPRLAVPDGARGVRLLEVRSVTPAEAVVEPLSWSPDPKRIHPVVLVSVPRPRCGLVLGGSAEDDVAAIALVRAAVAKAGPGGGASPDVRAVEPDEPVEGERLWIGARVVRGAKVLRILRADGEPVAPDVPGHSASSAAEVVRRAAHIARWDTLRTLENPVSGLAGAVQIEVSPIEEPATLLRPDGSGGIRLVYGRGGPPRVFIRLRNTSDRKLWCTLLDLTDQYRVHDLLFPCAEVGPGRVAPALEGKPVEVRLPGDRVRGNAQDWLKLIVAEQRFSSLRFDMRALGEPAVRGECSTRDIGSFSSEQGTGDWTTAVLPVAVAS